MKKIIFLELNEVNFQFLEKYIAAGHLPNFSRFFKIHGYEKTSCENVDDHIEPWIQWVSIHTGKSFAEHKIFYLGNSVRSEIPQIWEILEQKCHLKVGAISPINGVNRLKKPAFFIPDPWTQTQSAGSWILKCLSKGISEAVNDNAVRKITVKTKVLLLLGLLFYARCTSLSEYISNFIQIRKEPWKRVFLLDRLLADTLIQLWKKHQPDFCSLFLNGAAHIQHHYMFNSSCYEGNHVNPDWYISPGKDPLLGIYSLYDVILGEILSLHPDIRIMAATGLHQKPYGEITYYYRLRRHDRFLKEAGIKFRKVVPRMSRDFTIEFDSSEDAEAAAISLTALQAEDGTPLFQVDCQHDTLFVTLVYPKFIGKDFHVSDGKRKFLNFEKQVAFVAIKNACHDGIGYFMDTQAQPNESSQVMPVWKIQEKILQAFRE